MVKLQNFPQKIDEPVTVALGFFDCVHAGHRKLLDSARKLAEVTGSKLCVFTFLNSPASFFGGDCRVVNTFSERAGLLEALGAEYIFCTAFDGAFARMPAKEFLSKLAESNVMAVACGFDYRFGYQASGDSAMLEKFCIERGIAFKAQPQVIYKNQKLSTTLVKKFLENGDMKSAAECLERDYFLEGYVTAGHGLGSRLGFPTANILTEPEKLLPRRGVYGGRAEFDGVTKKCVVNVGGRPTFNDEADSVEAHIIDFSGDLYFKKLRISFGTYLRPVMRFESEKELAEQIGRNTERVKNER